LESLRWHAADTKIINGGKLLKNPQKRLRAERAVRADHLNILVFQLRRGIGGADIAVRRTFFRVGELGNDGQTGERANRIDSEEQFFDVRKRFEDVEVHAALFEGEGLFVKNILDLFGEDGATARPRPADRWNLQSILRGRPIHALRGQFFTPRLLRRWTSSPRPSGASFEAIGAEGVRFDDLRARFDVSLVHTEYRFPARWNSPRRKQRCEQPLRAAWSPSPIGYENRVFQTLIEILNFHLAWVLRTLSRVPFAQLAACNCCVSLAGKSISPLNRKPYLYNALAKKNCARNKPK